ncbi:MAG: site-specific integrase [Thalassobaculaceae bacterium]|uniref:tyrosine-type recombinase/integrase n=1 Tax=Roseitalea porphyridii TaxID=1852022 RepID=UPI0032F04F55
MQAYIQDKGSERARYSLIALKPFWGALRPDQICPELCRDYIAQRRSAGAGDGTILREMTDMRSSVRRYASNAGATFDMPSSPPPKDRHLTRDEYRSLREAAQSIPHLYLFIELALATGARSSALLGLTWGQIDFDRNRIDLGIGAKGKGRAIVPMTKTVRRALVAQQPRAETVFVVEYAGRQVGSVKKAFRSAADRAGLKGVTPHVLRHTAAVWMAEAGRPMSEIAQYLGHTSEKVTFRVYARYTPEYLAEAASALEID